LERFMDVTGDEQAAASLGVAREGNMYDITYDGGGPRRVSTGQSVVRIVGNAHDGHTLEKLRIARAARTRPAMDDKVVASWHALAVSAFARCGVLLEDAEQVARAEKGGVFMLEHMKHAHVWRGGSASGEADLDDTAYSAMAFWDLFEATGKEIYLAASLKYTDYAHQEFAAGDGGYYMVGSRDDIIARPRAREDNPLPNAAAVLGMVELRLAMALGQPGRRERAGEIADHLLGALGGAGYHSGQAMSLYREVRSDPVEVVYSFPRNEDNKLAWLKAGYCRRWGVVRIPLGASLVDQSLSRGRFPAETSSAFICHGGQCHAPSYSPAETARVLGQSH